MSAGHSQPPASAPHAPHYRQEAIDHQRWRFLGSPNAHLRTSSRLLILIAFLAVALSAVLMYTTYDDAGAQLSLASYVLRSLLGR
jgi:hypothetical protein